MPRYFFHVRTAEDLEVDPEGSEFADLEKAELDAQVAASEIVADMVRSGEPVDRHCFEITDENGTVLSTIPWRTSVHRH